MTINEKTSLLNAQQNGNGVMNKKDKLIIPMPKDPIFVFEEYWGGLSMAELLPYQDDPWWQRLRRTLLYSIWLAVILAFVSACIMAYFHRNMSCNIISSVPTKSSLLFIDTIASTTMMSDGVSGKLAP